ncbi:MAG TPA: dienelactone hydrolase family protein [Candidatus Binatia bacterium]|nr:dienelactone hydrolase family protein [Candidatus Binatia bacterium]
MLESDRAKLRTLTAMDGHRFTAYSAGDPKAQRGLVLLQEIFGLTAHMREVAEGFADAGYYAIAPALFDRVEPGIELAYAETKRGMQVREQISDEASLLDVLAAGQALGTPYRGVLGYCWGGTLAWWSATRQSLFDVAVAWYGSGIAKTRNEVPKIPVQLHFGGNDRAIPLDDVEAIRSARPEVEIYIYPGAGHCFGCHDRPEVYHAEATGLAQKRTLDFLNAHQR